VSDRLARTAVASKTKKLEQNAGCVAIETVLNWDANARSASESLEQFQACARGFSFTVDSTLCAFVGAKACNSAVKPVVFADEHYPVHKNLRSRHEHDDKS
jgi:hypothetical protein